MEAPARDDLSPEASTIRDSASPTVDDQHSTPSSASSSRAPSSENSPVTITEVQSMPLGPSQRSVQYKGKKLPTVSELIGDPQITFLEHEERVRAHANLLPDHLYRTFYEGSATLSAFVTKDCLVKHRDVPHLKLQEGNGFQNIGERNLLKNMTPERMRRQHITNKKFDPSPFVSAFDNIEEAETKASGQYNQSRLVGHRVAVAEITTAGLIPATIRGKMRTFQTAYRNNSLVVVNDSAKDRDIKIPVWIRDTARPDDGSSVTLQDLNDSGADMWVVGSEMNLSGPYDMRYGAADTHDSEWLCCGPVPISVVGRVMPFDGDKLHLEKGCTIVVSTQSIETYIFNWEQRMWRHSPNTIDYRPFRLEIVGDKRARPNGNRAGNGVVQRSKRVHGTRTERALSLGFSNIIVLVDFPPPGRVGTVLAAPTEDIGEV